MKRANCLPVDGEIRYQRSAFGEASSYQRCQVGGAAGIGSPLKIKLEQVTPASAFCNSERSIVRIRNPRSSSSARVFGKETGMITTLLIDNAFAPAGS